MPYITIQGCSHYNELKGNKHPLVLVHGGFVDARMWDPQFEHFSDRFQVMRYDLRGHGRTGPSTLSKYSLETFAEDLAALLDVLELENPVVCGLSLGGMITFPTQSR